jgi:predicted nucleotidyltransferase
VAEINQNSPVLREIVSRLVRAYEPQSVYLFGSVARGESTAESDIDVLVLVPDDAAPEHRRGSLAFHALRGIDASVDVVVWTRGYFNSRQSVRSSLPAVISQEGKLLYAA